MRGKKKKSLHLVKENQICQNWASFCFAKDVLQILGEGQRGSCVTRRSRELWIWHFKEKATVGELKGRCCCWGSDMVTCFVTLDWQVWNCSQNGGNSPHSEKNWTTHQGRGKLRDSQAGCSDSIWAPPAQPPGTWKSTFGAREPEASTWLTLES